MSQDQSTAPQFPTADQVADAIANHFNVVIVGIANLNPQIPQKTMVEAIVIAIGNLVSGYSKSPDLATTLQSRGDLQDAFVRALRKRVPAIETVQAVAPVQVLDVPVPPASAPITANDGDAQTAPAEDHPLVTHPITQAELDAILNSEDTAPVSITLDGRVVPYDPALAATAPADAPASVQAADSAPVADTEQAAA